MAKTANQIITIAIIIAIVMAFIIRIPLTVYAKFPLAESNSDTASEEAQEYYNKLPQGVRDAFESNGWKVIITDVFKVNYVSALYHGAPSGGYVAGYTETISKNIVLSNTDAGAAMNHEMGHFFDYVLANSISTSEEFITIYNEECEYLDDGVNDYAMSDSTEYFAEAFREYVECAGYLNKCCPNTYKAMNKLVGPYGGTQTDSITTLTRCESHVIKETAKQAANKLADLAVIAVDKVLESDKNPVKSRTLDEWLDKAKETYQDIKDNPEEWGRALAEKANKKVNDWDAEATGKELADKMNKKVEELNENIDSTDWGEKGRQAAERLNKFFGAD